MFNRNNKGQAAMEFLMTYGWAILVVLAAIAALAYFGVLSPDRFMPEKCTLPSGTACLDSAGSTSEVSMVVQNAAGYDMDNITMTIDFAAGTLDCTSQATGGTDNGTLANGAKDTFVCAGTAIPEGKFQGDVSFNYINRQSELEHTQVGELILKID